MAFLKGLRREESVTAVAPNGNGRPASTAREAAALEALIARADAAAQQFRSLDSLIEKAESLGELHERMGSVHRQLRMQDLERDRAVVLDVLGEEHGRHAAAPDLAEQLVSPSQPRLEV